MEKTVIYLHVNGTVHEVHCEPRKLLSDVLREDCRLTGTHVGCEHGVCGACTVQIDGRPVRACLIYAVQMEEARIRRSSRVGRTAACLPLQQALHECHGLQCGFCTPGIVMTFDAYLRENPDPTPRRSARGAVRQSVPLHRLSEHRAGDSACGRAAARGGVHV